MIEARRQAMPRQALEDAAHIEKTNGMYGAFGFCDFYGPAGVMLARR
jgi:hypothetical protein